MNNPVTKQRIVLCGSPGAGKRRLLEAFAQHVGGPSPIVTPATAGEPVAVSFEMEFGSGNLASFAALHGPGFYYESSVARLLSSPVSAIIYVLRAMNPDFEQSWRSLELSNFSTYSGAARKHGRMWDTIPWLFIKHRARSTDAVWMDELIPASHVGSVVLVNSNEPRGVEDLSKAIDAVVAGLFQL